MNARETRGPWVIVPVKTLAEAKQRLAGELPPEMRRRLMEVMLRDVLATLREVDGLGPVVVVTPDAEVAGLAESFGARVLREARAQGHSAAAMAGFAHAVARGAARALTLPADAPLVTPAEVARLIDVAGTEGRARVVLAPSHDRDGTNAVLAAPPDIFRPSFGPGSFARHVAAAEAQRLDCRVVELAGLGMDVDEPRDLQALLARKRGDPSYAFLQDWQVPCGAISATSIEPTRP
jgi:2-phospho-L-lactate/phosphoenolpyruvate guanylyltransferase